MTTTPSATVIPAPTPVRLAVAGESALFPVRRVYCVGRNYAEHAKEMKADERDPPFFFQKPADALVPDGATIPYPPLTKDLHHEVELVVALASGGRNIRVEDALAHVYGYAIGLDLTRRDLQGVAKSKGWPWEIGKAFDQSAPCGPIHPAAKVGHRLKGAIALDVNGARRQTGDLADMTWKVPEIIAKLSESYELFGGDLIMTGTPAGVGAIVAGDKLVGTIEGLGALTVTIGPPR